MSSELGCPLRWPDASAIVQASGQWKSGIPPSPTLAHQGGHCPRGVSGYRPSYPLRLGLRPASLSLLPLCAHPLYLALYVPRPCTHVGSQFCSAAPCNRKAQTQTFWDRQGPQTFHLQPTQSSIHFSTSHTFKSWTRRLPPQLSRFLCACRSLFGALPFGYFPTTALRPPAKLQSPLFESSAISLHVLSHAAFVLTLRPAVSRHPRIQPNPHAAHARAHHPLQIGTALATWAFWPAALETLDLYLASSTFSLTHLRCQS